MHLNKTDGFTLGFVIIAALAVLVNGYLKQPDLKDQIEIVDSYYPSEVIDTSIEKERPLNEIAIEDKPETIVNSIAVPNSFSEAFAEARRMKGPNAIFEWNGNSYTTSFTEEIVKPGEQLDSTRINLVHNQSTEK